MEQAVYMASCPVCGRALFRGAPNSYIEGGCPKCKKFLQILFTDDGVKSSVAEKQTSNEQKEINITKLPKR